MRQRENENGGGARTPNPHTITVKATALVSYAIPKPYDNREGQWLAIPRQQIEHLIETAIEWLDMIDRLETQPQTGENGK